MVIVKRVHIYLAIEGKEQNNELFWITNFTFRLFPKKAMKYQLYLRIMGH